MPDWAIAVLMGASLAVVYSLDKIRGQLGEIARLLKVLADRD